MIRVVLVLKEPQHMDINWDKSCCSQLRSTPK